MEKISMSNTEIAPPSARCELHVIFESSAWQSLDFDCQQEALKAAEQTLLATDIYNYTRKVEIALLLADDERLQQLNSDFRNVNKPTNVLSFPFQVLNPLHLEDIIDKEHLFLGDVAISWQRILEESIAQNKELQAHFVHMVVHSVLHLIGYDHETSDADAHRMESLEIEILKQLKIDNPYIIKQLI
jgi:probable rRNA maturation factor